MPKFLFTSLDANAKKNMTTWRKMVNQGDNMEKKDLVNPGKRNEVKNPDLPPKKPGNRRNGKTCRVTKTRRVGT